MFLKNEWLVQICKCAGSSKCNEIISKNSSIISSTHSKMNFSVYR